MEGSAVASRGSASAASGLRPPRFRPRVSIVIPTYNRAASLSRLLCTLNHCVMPEGGVEVIVVNDGCTDSTSMVTAAAGVRCLEQPNYGRAAARERGWRSSRGDIIVFLDDDVVPQPDAVERLVVALDSADAAGATISPLDTSRVVAHYVHVDSIVNHHIVDGDPRWLITAAAAFRRSALERVGGFDLTYHQAGEDVDLTLRLIEAGGAITLVDDAVVYHDHRASMWQLWSTCYRYGRAYRTLAARHPIHRRERRRSALGRLNPAEWRRLYNGYRLITTARRSLAFMLLHALVALPYAVGLLRGERPATDPELIRDIDFPDGADIDLAGAAVAAPVAALALVEEGAPAA